MYLTEKFNATMNKSLRKNMNQTLLPGKYKSPVVIGGVGGSGTRLIAQCLKELGYYMGDDLNGANDNLWFTLLFKRIEILSSTDEEFHDLVDILFKGITGIGGFSKEQVDLIKVLASKDRGPHPAFWLAQRASSLLLKRPAIDSDARWGWKEPNSHIVLDRLNIKLKGMKYIHIIRNGLDMAYSNNQNQLRSWGAHFINEPFYITPHYSLKFWCLVHRRVLSIGKTMGPRFLLLNYDDFCTNPEHGILQLCNFLDLDAGNEEKRGLTDLIRVPDSIGRFKQYDTKIFSDQDVAYVKSIGFDTGESQCY